MTIQQLNKELGNIDLYLLDQILKANIPPTARVLDAGCGEGRNLIYFLNNGYNVHGIDQNPDAIRMLQFIAGSNYPDQPKGNFIEGQIHDMPYPDQCFDLVISSAVLHFSPDTATFWAGVKEMTRVLRPGGMLFIRMTAIMGLEDVISPQGEQHALPDGSVRFLITESIIEQLQNDYNYSPIEATKSVLVDRKRCMTTLVLRKNQIEL
ncbi:class I SAM-dependent methyltransferase [Reichenbachiella agariperforans]|uniref:class I SAM-dependent methyltransferase n=1 Tax=Reichenbachiella agariperforans TaxID=156994 RepID=UPI001C095ED7|nr:class I SAM-dependent methyltransferase [Reichenbachiella agariperforans]MBU2914226.1 class I SAM-dependent methyltransferase [Reichenbachiella agariperforans]